MIEFLNEEKIRDASMDSSVAADTLMLRKINEIIEAVNKLTPVPCECKNQGTRVTNG